MKDNMFFTGFIRWQHSLRFKFIAGVLAVALSLAPVSARADVDDCENPLVPFAVAAVLIAVTTVLITTFFYPEGFLGKDFKDATETTTEDILGGQKTDIDLSIPIITAGIGQVNLSIDMPSGMDTGGLDYMDQRMRLRLDEFWVDLRDALQGMGKELYASAVNVSRLASSNYDAESLSGTGLDIQDEELKAKDKGIVTDEACVFDTLANYSNAAGQVGTGVSGAMSLQTSMVSGNNVNSVTAGGSLSLNEKRLTNNTTRFCDPNSNGGVAAAGCASQPGLENADVLPSRTLFEKTTIPLNDPNPARAAAVEEAVGDLIYNLTGYEAPPRMDPTVLKAGPGKEQRQTNRQYSAQMDAVMSLITSIVAERAPGKDAPPVKALLNKIGITDASSNPSEREIREAQMAELWDPSYYSNTSDSVGTLTQKENYLRAYNIVLLNKLIDKTERISTVQAIETVNMMKGMPGSSSRGLSKFVPF